jgi:predicted DNA-binding transcriptional regulator AlpA
MLWFDPISQPCACGYVCRVSRVQGVQVGMSEEGPTLLSQGPLARLLGLSERTLERWRSEHLGPPFVRLVGLGSVRYRKADIDEWLEAQLVRPSRSHVRVQGSERLLASWSSRVSRSPRSVR